MAAAMCSPVIAYWRYLANVIELGIPSAHWSPQLKRQIDRFSPFLHNLRQKVPILDNGHPSTRIALSHGAGGSGPHGTGGIWTPAPSETCVTALVKCCVCVK